jgi:hypothetical protein
MLISIPRLEERDMTSLLRCTALHVMIGSSTRGVIDASGTVFLVKLRSPLPFLLCNILVNGALVLSEAVVAVTGMECSLQNSAASAAFANPNIRAMSSNGNSSLYA